MSEPIEIPGLGPSFDELWRLLIDLADLRGAPWTLVGGQMVLLHGLEYDRYPPAISEDADAVANVRAKPRAIATLVGELKARGFEVDGMSPNSIAHRYIKDAKPLPLKIDILAPEGLDPRTDLTSTRPGRTVQVPGGTQALARTERVAVRVAGTVGVVPRPSLLGAVVLKAAATAIPVTDAAKHHRDLAFLCSLIADPRGMRETMTKKDVKRLKFAGRLRDRTHAAWALIDEPYRSDGYAAYQIIAS